MKSTGRTPDRWLLVDLIDFEAVLAATPQAGDGRDRLRFARDIRPRLPRGDALAARRYGLKRWLDIRREAEPIAAGTYWQRALTAARFGWFCVMGLSGLALAAGLCLAAGQTVHVVVFLALALVLPWAVFCLLLAARWAGARQHYLLDWIIARIARLAERHGRGGVGRHMRTARERLTDTTPARKALGAALAGVFQWGAVGFYVGLILAFMGCLAIFDVRFYWEATPQTDALMTTATDTIAAPWAWFWFEAVPDQRAIQASRARYIDGRKQIPGDRAAGAAWWRFLLMSLLIWGLLPRVLLAGMSHWQQRRALAGLDFQAPRHRALWRRLSAVERGAVAPAAADGALVLDVGGIGVTGTDVRGFLLRVLRVNPQADHRIAVLDETAEAQADAALAQQPDHIVLLVDARDISPHRIRRLHERVRAAAGAKTPITWAVLSVSDGAPAPPAGDALARWTRFIDGLRDPAAEIVAYDASA